MDEIKNDLPWKPGNLDSCSVSDFWTSHSILHKDASEWQDEDTENSKICKSLSRVAEVLIADYNRAKPERELSSFQFWFSVFSTPLYLEENTYLKRKHFVPSSGLVFVLAGNKMLTDISSEKSPFLTSIHKRVFVKSHHLEYAKLWNDLSASIQASGTQLEAKSSHGEERISLKCMSYCFSFLVQQGEREASMFDSSRTELKHTNLGI